MSANIHEALDNIEAQFAVLIANLGPGVADNLIEAIADNIEAVRVGIETRSVAEVTAQNTNFADLQSTLASLRLICQSVTRVSISNYFDPVQQTVPGGGLSDPPTEPFEDFDIPDAQIPDRRCWAANQIVEETEAWFATYDDFQLDEIANVTFLSFMSLWVAGLATIATDTIIIAEVAATVSPVLSAIASYAYNNIGLLEFSNIVTAIDNRHDDLVCALYEAPDVFNARGAFVGILGEEGIDITNRDAVAIYLDDFYLNSLFYRFSEQVEAAYQAAAGYSCMDCDVVCDLWVHPANTIISDDGSTIEIQAAQTNAPQGDFAYYVYLYLSATSAPAPCDDYFTVDNFAITSGVAGGAGPVIYRVYSGVIGTVGDLYHSNAIPTSPISGARGVVVKSLQTFNVQLDYVLEP